MTKKAVFVVLVLSLVMIASVLLLWILMRINLNKGDVPIPTKLLLNKIRLSRNQGDFNDPTDSVNCLRKKLKLTRLSIEIELEKNIKFDDILASRIDAAYGSAAIPCVELKNTISELQKERNSNSSQIDGANSTESDVEICVKENLQTLKPNSVLLKDFESNESENFTNCTLVVELLIDKHENAFENFYKKSQLQKCKEDDFVQLNSFKIFAFESHLAKFVKLSNETFDKLTEEMTNLANEVSERQIQCIFKEIYPKDVKLASS